VLQEKKRQDECAHQRNGAWAPDGGGNVVQGLDVLILEEDVGSVERLPPRARRGRRRGGGNRFKKRTGVGGYGRVRLTL